MSHNKSLFRFVAIFLVVTFLFGSVYTAIGATGDGAGWIGDTDEILDANKDYVFPTPEERAAQKALAGEKVAEKTAVEADTATEKAAEKTAVEADTATEKAAEETAVKVDTAAEKATEEAAKVVADEAVEKVDEATDTAVDTTTGQQSSEDTATDEEEAKKDAEEDVAIEQAIEESRSAYTDEEKDAVKEIVASALADELDKTDGEPVRVYLGNGKWGEVDKNNLDEFNRLVGLHAGGKLGSDLNNNGIDDSIEAEKGKVPFDDDKKEELENEIVYGVTRENAGRPVLVSAPSEDSGMPQVLGGEPLFKLKDPANVSGERVVITLKDENGNDIESLSVETDENGVAVYKPSALKNGKYSVVAVDADGNVLTTNDFEVDSDKAPAAPKLTFGDELSMNPAEDDVASFNYGQVSVLGADAFSKSSFDITKYLIKAYIYKVFPYLDPRTEDVVAVAGIPVVQEEKPKVLYGSAQPGTKIFITWKSIVRSSVVIADANGKFKVEDRVGPGNHEVFAFVYDPKNNFVGNVSSIFFKK